MARKINLNFMLVIATSVLLTVLFTTALSYRLFQREVFSNLSAFAGMVEELGFIGRMKEEGGLGEQKELRVTWIAADGSVLYDSYAQDSALKNHRDRPEVREAMEQGEGKSIRQSETMGQNIFFYARKTEDGSVLRIAKEAGSIWSVYCSTLPATVLIAFLSFLISMWIARCLTQSFVRPIAQMADDISHGSQAATYRELAPFMELIRAQHREVLENAKIRQEFTANVSHELKTPLTSISGYAELIANGMASKKEGRRFAGEIHANAQRLLTLINDILQLSELEAPHGQALDLEPVEVYGLAALCLEMIGPVARKHGVSVSLEGKPLTIYGDKGLVGELLYNLCDNAIRYNKKGGHVWIRVYGQLAVQDDGIGISPKYQKRVFERFFRVDKSRSRKTGGTVLGLAIVKHIAEAHNAAITLESEEGRGTVVSVKFPAIGMPPAQPSSLGPTGLQAGPRDGRRGAAQPSPPG